MIVVMVVVIVVVEGSSYIQMLSNGKLDVMLSNANLNLNHHYLLSLASDVG